jgi:hypothetical protein
MPANHLENRATTAQTEHTRCAAFLRAFRFQGHWRSELLSGKFQDKHPARYFLVESAGRGRESFSAKLLSIGLIVGRKRLPTPWPHLGTMSIDTARKSAGV